MTTHDTRIGVFCRYCNAKIFYTCYCDGAISARDESIKQREITAAEELAESLISQGWTPPQPESGKSLHWKMSGNRIIPDYRPRCQATHPDQGPCELPIDHAGKHGWSEPSAPERGWEMGDGRWDAV